MKWIIVSLTHEWLFESSDFAPGLATGSPEPVPKSTTIANAPRRATIRTSFVLLSRKNTTNNAL